MWSKIGRCEVLSQKALTDLRFTSSCITNKHSLFQLVLCYLGQQVLAKVSEFLSTSDDIENLWARCGDLQIWHEGLGDWSRVYINIKTWGTPKWVLSRVFPKWNLRWCHSKNCKSWRHATATAFTNSKNAWVFDMLIWSSLASGYQSSLPYRPVCEIMRLRRVEVEKILRF